jgi:hypothetical protein
MFLREIVSPNLPFHREFSDIYCCILCHIWMYEFMYVPYNASAVTDDKRLLKYSFFPETCPMGKSLKKIFRWCNIHRMENTSCCLIWPKAIILIYWNVIFIWETGYWTRAIKRFALIDLLKCLYSDTNILSKYIPSLQKKL